MCSMIKLPRHICPHDEDTECLWEGHQCSGNGKCLYRNGLNSFFRRFPCPFQCEVVRCHNYLLCGIIFPQWVSDRQNKGLCMMCNIHFGMCTDGLERLTFVEGKCSTCKQQTQCVLLPTCTHCLCFSCFTKCGWPRTYYGEPQLPEEIREEWEAHPNDPKWKTNEMVQQHQRDVEEYYDNMNHLEPHFMKCPICR